MSISAMKQALQALEFFCEYGVIDRPFERIAELKQAIAEAEKQPVHASDISQECVDETAKDRHEDIYDIWVETPCKTHPDAPHGFDRNASHSADRYVCECEGWEPPKEWVGLTDEEVADYWVEAFNENGLYVQTFAKLIEAKLKEKNGG